MDLLWPTACRVFGFGKRDESYRGNRTSTITASVHLVQVTHVADLLGHEGPVWQVAWGHPKFGNLLASASFDHRVIIWKEGPDGAWAQVRSRAHVINMCLQRQNCPTSWRRSTTCHHLEGEPRWRLGSGAQTSNCNIRSHHFPCPRLDAEDLCVIICIIVWKQGPDGAWPQVRFLVPTLHRLPLLTIWFQRQMRRHLRGGP